MGITRDNTCKERHWHGVNLNKTLADHGPFLRQLRGWWEGSPYFWHSAASHETLGEGAIQDPE